MGIVSLIANKKAGMNLHQAGLLRRCEGAKHPKQNDLIFCRGVFFHGAFSMSVFMSMFTIVS